MCIHKRAPEILIHLLRQLASLVVMLASKASTFRPRYSKSMQKTEAESALDWPWHLSVVGIGHVEYLVSQSE